MKPKHVGLTLMAFLLLAPPSSAWAAVEYKVLHSFGSGSDGAGPFGPLAFDGKGNLYGVTGGGGDGCGDGGCGTVYQLSPGSGGKWKETVLYNATFESPAGGLVVDASGNIYGTASVAYATGGVFELSPSSGGYSFNVLYSGGDSGPGLLRDDLGNLYGEMGPGQEHDGAIGELSPGSRGWTYTQLYGVCCNNGIGPPAPPIWDGKGNMFGTMTAGGIYKGCNWSGGCGVIYEMTPNGDGTWTYRVLHLFLEHNPKDGQNPRSGLLMDKSGNFYGATVVGGPYGDGTVFKLAYKGGHWQETILYDFPNCIDGCGVAGTLAMDKHGNLYGTAGGGTGNCGESCGVVFKLSSQKNGKWKYSVVFDLNPETGGSQPFYGVTLDGKGNMFSVTSRGGKYGFGTAFEITP